jgi:hypothetical protein
VSWREKRARGGRNNSAHVTVSPANRVPGYALLPPTGFPRARISRQRGYGVRVSPANRVAAGVVEAGL